MADVADVTVAAEKNHFRHISDIDVWLTADRNYFVFILLSVFTGFFALDHVYLRSFDTAIQKLLYNIFGLGIWYVWDLCQIFTDGKRVQADGLSSPFDWTQGIGRGVFSHKHEPDQFVPEKSYIIWAFLAIFGGFFALDKFYLGDVYHGITKLISIFSPLFLFGILWVMWDSFHAIFMTKDILSNTIALPMPLTWFGFKETSGSVFLPGVPKERGISAIAKGIMSMPATKLENMLALTGIPALASTVGSLTDRMRLLGDKAQAMGVGAASSALAAPAATAVPALATPLAAPTITTHT